MSNKNDKIQNGKPSYRINCQSYEDTHKNTNMMICIYVFLLLSALFAPFLPCIPIFADKSDTISPLLSWISTVIVALSTLLLVLDTLINKQKETNNKARTFIIKYSEIMGGVLSVKASLEWFEKNKDSDVQLYDNLMFTEFALLDKETRNWITALLKTSYNESEGERPCRRKHQ